MILGACCTFSHHNNQQPPFSGALSTWMGVDKEAQRGQVVTEPTWHCRHQAKPAFAIPQAQGVDGGVRSSGKENLAEAVCGTESQPWGNRWMGHKRVESWSSQHMLHYPIKIHLQHAKSKNTLLRTSRLKLQSMKLVVPPQVQPQLERCKIPRMTENKFITHISPWCEDRELLILRARWRFLPCFSYKAWFI